MKRFLKNSIPDAILCSLMTFAAGTTIFSAFYVPKADVKHYFFTAGVSIAIIILMIFASYNKISIVIGISATVLGFVGLIIAAVSGGYHIFSDSLKNPFLRILILFLVALVIFLLSRFRVGAVLLFPAGTIALCLTEFMYESRHLVCFFMYLVGSVMMIIYRNYMHNVLNSRTIKNAQISAIAYALVLSLLVAAAGSGIFYGVLQRFDLPKKDLKVITKYLSLEVLERIGVADTELVKDPDTKTNRQNQQQDTTKDQSKNKDKDLNNAQSEANQNDSDSGNGEDSLDKQDQGPFSAIRYDWGIPLWAVLVIAGVLLIIAIFATKYFLRYRRHRKMLQMKAEDRFKAMYLFFMKKFKILKIYPVTGETPMEFAERNRDRLHCFNASGTDFEALTEILVRTEYAGEKATLEDIKRFETFYRKFYGNCCTYLGRIQYMLKFFIL